MNKPLTVAEREEIRKKKEAERAESKESVVSKLINQPPSVEDFIQPVKKKETRSAQMTIKVTPTLRKKVNKKAKSVGVSVNEAIVQFLEKWTDDID